MKPYSLFIALLLGLSAVATAQTSIYYPDNSIKVTAYGRELPLAWCGGFNNAQFSMGDLNNDGLQDLVVYTKGIGVQTFINKGMLGGVPYYEYFPQYADNFPPCYDYLIMVDYNHDHIPDVFEQGITGVNVYKGYYNSRNQLCFSQYKQLYYYNDLCAGGAANAFNNPGDIPAVVDVDGDGDYDIVSYDILGGYMNLYKNKQADLGLPADSIYIALRDKCWGKVYQGFYRTHNLGTSCDNSCLGSKTSRGNKMTHTGNTPCLFDYDMDGDYDYLDGSVSFNEMTFLKNGRIENGGVDSMIYQDTMWQTGGTQIDINTWPAAFNIDIDQDGKPDLLISPNGGGLGLSADNTKNVWFYKNYSTTGHPDWRYVTDSMLVGDAIDCGTNATPMLFDYNKDGKLDLFIGSDGYANHTTGIMRSRMSLYENTSTPGNPSFNLVTTNFLNMDTCGFQGTSPAFGDLDHDGIKDMVVGHNDGSITFYKNTATSDTVTPVYSYAQRILTDNTGAQIYVSGNAMPFIYDIDHDGNPDLLVGNYYGTLYYYRNISTTAGVKSLKLITQNLGHIQADPAQTAGCNSAPFIGKIDSTGVDKLIMGSNSGNIYLFDGLSGDTSVTYHLVDTNYSFIDSANNGYNHYGSIIAAYWNLKATPVVGDVSGSGKFQMFIGDTRGGVRSYQLKRRDNYSTPILVEDARFILFPNPTGDYLNVNWSGILSDNIMVEITDMQGRRLYGEQMLTQQQTAHFDVSGYVDGMYMLSVTSGERKYTQKFTIVR